MPSYIFCVCPFLACVMAVNVCHRLHLKLKPTGSDLCSDHTFAYVEVSKSGVFTIRLS